MNQSVNNDFSNATDIADYLVTKKVPFREAYHIVGKIVKYCLSQKQLFRNLTLDEFKKFHSFFEDDIFKLIDPKNVVDSRNSIGGTGFKQVQIELNSWKKKLLI